MNSSYALKLFSASVAFDRSSFNSCCKIRFDRYCFVSYSAATCFLVVNFSSWLRMCAA